NEYLFNSFGDQDISVTGLDVDKFKLLDINSQSKISFQNKGCFYITFDPNDSVFGKSRKFYSVNNLDGKTAVPGWRGDVPANTADIIVTTAVGNTVRHIEVFLTLTISDAKMKNGSRGTISLKTNEFNFSSADKSVAPVIHSDANSPSSPSIKIQQNSDWWGLNMDKNAVISGCSTIDVPHPWGPVPDNIKENQPEQQVPALPVTDLVKGITFNPTPLPSGTYRMDAAKNTLYYYKEENITDYSSVTPVATYACGWSSGPADKGTQIVPGVNVKDYVIEISNNIKVAASDGASTPELGETGNLIIRGTRVKFTKKGISLYADAPDANWDTATSKYIYGNIDIDDDPDRIKWDNWDKLVEGKGNIYAKGTIDLRGSVIDAGITSDDIALYAQGDINLDVKHDTNFKGLIYTNGDFNASVGKGWSAWGSLSIEGALIAAGKSVKDGYTEEQVATDQGTIEAEADKISIKFDDSVLAPLTYGGGAYALRILSWHEF
ncbi:MAG: hypothetical protein ABRQ39_28890, partial [Candidatus Eremiobacterota bacterium]